MAWTMPRPHSLYDLPSTNQPQLTLLQLHQKSIGALYEDTFDSLDEILNMTVTLKAEHEQLAKSGIFVLFRDVRSMLSAASYLANRLAVLLSSAVVISPVYHRSLAGPLWQTIACSLAFGLTATVFFDALGPMYELLRARDAATNAKSALVALALTMVGYTLGFLLHHRAAELDNTKVVEN